MDVLTCVYLAALLGVYLLYPGLGGYETITAQKWQAYLLLTAGYTAAALLIPLELALVGAGKLPSPKTVWQAFGLPQKAAVFYLLFTALSAVFSPYQSTALWGSGRHEGLAAIALYCAGFLLVSVHGRPRRWMLWVFAGAMSLNCLLALIQMAGYNPLGLYPEGMTYFDANKLYSGEFLGTAGNVDILSAIMCLTIPALLAAVVFWKETKARLLLLGAAALCTVVWLRSFVAGGILGVLGAALLSAPVLLKSKKARRTALIAVAAVLVLGAGTVYMLGDRMGGFLFEAHELMHGRWEDSYGSGRIYIWRNVLPLAGERPLLGGGPDTLGLRTDAAFERYDETLDILIHSSIDVAHNEYLNILVNQGIPALLAYALLLGSSAVRWVRRASAEPVTAICGCAVLGYCIQAFFGISSPISAPYLWIALAFLNPVEIPKPTTPARRKQT